MVTERRFADRIRDSGARLAHLLVVEDGDVDELGPAAGFDFESAWRAVAPEDVLCLIYTSGTTGPPKGVEHTHRGALALAAAVDSAFPMTGDDVGISYLPSSHAADRFLTHYFTMLHGAEITTIADLRQLAPTLATVRPTIFAAVPRVWEKLKFGIETQVQADEQVAAGFAADVPQVVDAIRAKIGFDRLKWALSGAAAIPPHVYAFMRKLGVPVSEVWGMSECGLATGTSPAEAKQATVGKPFPGLETRVLDDGELLVRGPWLMRGYRNDPEKTAETIDPEGWLRTGDIVTVDDDGYLMIVDRKKELIINAGGKNMSPSNIEHAISEGSMLIGPVMAVGDGRPYNVALITLDPDAATAFAARIGVDADPAVLCKDARVRTEIQASVDAGNQKLSRVEQIKRFAVLPTYWEPGGDEMTPTSKLKRKPISRKYAAEIEDLYAQP